MNYEEKYRRALKKALDMLDHHEVRREDMEYLFPEIAESEDERIRQRIIHALHGDVLSLEETDKAVAWLEKQKDSEQKNPTVNADAMVDKYSNTELYYDDGVWFGKPIPCMIRAYRKGIEDTLNELNKKN